MTKAFLEMGFLWRKEHWAYNGQNLFQFIGPADKLLVFTSAFLFDAYLF